MMMQLKQKMLMTLYVECFLTLLLSESGIHILNYLLSVGKHMVVGALINK